MTHSYDRGARAETGATRLAADVAIIGGGPVGVCSAILLAQHGLTSIVVERHPSPYPLPRAVHIDDEVLRILHTAGVAEPFRIVSRPGRGLRLVDRRLREIVRFDRAESEISGFPQANMFQQPDLEAILRRHVDGVPEVDLACGVEFIGLRHETDGVSVTARDFSTGRDVHISSRYLLGCDGARSDVRAAIGSRMVDMGFEQRWLVLDVDLGEEVTSWGGVDQVFDRDRPGTYMQITDTRHRWEFRLADGEQATDFATSESVEPLIRPWVGATSVEDIEIVRAAEYTFRAQVCDRWRSGNVFLLGDAAHLTPPFIGQGLGAGLRDAANLAWKIAAHRRSGDDGLLESYEQERKPHAKALINKAVFIGALMSSPSILANAARSVVLPYANVVPSIGALIMSSVTPRLRTSEITTSRDVTNGRLCPIPLGATRAHGILLAYAAPTATLSDACHAKGLAVHSQRDAGTPDRWRRGRKFVLIRPDGVVVASSNSAARMLRSVQDYAKMFALDAELTPTARRGSSTRARRATAAMPHDAPPHLPSPVPVAGAR